MRVTSGDPGDYMEALFYLDVRIKSEHDVLLLGGGGRSCWAFFTIKEFDKNVGWWYFPGMFFLTFGREPAVFLFWELRT